MSPSRCRLQLTVYGALLVVLGLVAAPGALSQDPRPCATKANGSYVCPDCSPSAANSSRGAAFEANVLRFRDALKVMSAGGNATFLNATFAAAGDAAGDMVYGLAACLADAERIACAACLAAAAAELPGTRCGGARAMVLWYPVCLVRYDNTRRWRARCWAAGCSLRRRRRFGPCAGSSSLCSRPTTGSSPRAPAAAAPPRPPRSRVWRSARKTCPRRSAAAASGRTWTGLASASRTVDGVRLNGASCYLRYDLKAVDPRPSTVAPPRATRSLGKKTIIYIVAGVPGAVCLLLLGAGGWLWWQRKTKQRRRGSRSRSRSSSLSSTRVNTLIQQQLPQRYSYADVREMTSSFTERLGQGGFGTVYKGRLPDGRDVAVKMLNETKDDFLNEVSSISSTSHVNVVKLLGFCLDVSKTTGKACLIYEYMPKGSLDRYAVGRGGERLSWDRMFNIVVGVARGLEYLHRGCNDHILHLDIKPHNILLDQNLRPKISDFGLAKIRPQESNIAVSVTIGKGTISYMAPELIWPHLAERPGVATSKADVYSYGMTVLEVVGARRSVDNGEGASGSSDDDPGNYLQLLYDDLDGFCRTAACGCDDQAGAEDLLKKMTVVGLWCIRFSPKDRPTMSKVVEMLENTSIHELERPPRQAL
ncbi:hypothetical protein BS78_05G071900 [Paspalum vaginatum]|nr:hypothetical protein BS78_05G071900 [Paspalum vaginatum]